jgi:SNF2 family DNA or RNA helicase
VIDEFLTGESRLLCLSMCAGAYGVNLVPGPTAMIILGVWYNPAMHRQVEARIHRIGQTRPVVVYTLVARGTVEAAILATHDEKESCATEMLSGEHEVSEERHPPRLLWQECDALQTDSVGSRQQ